MARETVFIAAPPEEVFAVLADPRVYAHWVVGSHKIRAADASWPAPGAGFDHQVGQPPLLISDETVVLASDPPHSLELLAKARPMPNAVVRLELRPTGSGADGQAATGTHVTMIEDLAQPLLNRLLGPVGHGALRLRNREALRRLRLLVEHPERRSQLQRAPLPPRSQANH